MEEHPDFLRVVEELKAKGYELKYAEGDPHVVVREVLTPQGERIRVEKEIVVRKGMRYLDLEHELGHVAQSEGFAQTRFTEQVLADGKPYKGPNTGMLLTKQLDAITEYHNRLVEYLRLKDRGVPPDVLTEHADGVRAARDVYWDKGRARGRSLTGRKFVEENFPDLSDLEARFMRESGDE